MKPPISFSWFKSLPEKLFPMLTQKNPLVNPITRLFRIITTEEFQNQCLFSKAINNVEAIRIILARLPKKYIFLLYSCIIEAKDLPVKSLRQKIELYMNMFHS